MAGRWYNVTKVGNSTGVVNFLQNVNGGLLNGWFGSMILITFFMIVISSFLYKSQGDVKRSLLGASALTAIVALGFKVLYLIPNVTFFISLIMVGVSLFIVIFSDN